MYKAEDEADPARTAFLCSAQSQSTAPDVVLNADEATLRAHVAQLRNSNPQVRVDIGGTIFVTRASTLLHASPGYVRLHGERRVENIGMLGKMLLQRALKREDNGRDRFSGGTPPRGGASRRLFLDRDGTHYRHILNFLRDGKVVVTPDFTHYRELLGEAVYCRLPLLVDFLTASMRTMAESNPHSPSLSPHMSPSMLTGTRVHSHLMGSAVTTTSCSRSCSTGGSSPQRSESDARGAGGMPSLELTPAQPLDQKSEEHRGTAEMGMTPQVLSRGLSDLEDLSNKLDMSKIRQLSRQSSNASSGLCPYRDCVCRTLDSMRVSRKTSHEEDDSAAHLDEKSLEVDVPSQVSDTDSKVTEPQVVTVAAVGPATSNKKRSVYVTRLSDGSILLGDPASNVLDWEEIQKHNTKESCWLVVHDRVYDATPMIPHHPGGAEAITKRGGQDATRDFQFHSKGAQRLWKRFHIGQLKGGKRMCLIM